MSVQKKMERMIMLALMMFFLIVSFCLIDSISIRFILYAALSFYTSVELTRLLTRSK